MLLAVIELGAKVLLGEDDVPATVAAVLIKAGPNVTYECVWWDGRKRNQVWCPASELTSAAEEDTRLTIGFHSNGQAAEHE